MTELASKPGERASDSNGAAITPINHWIDGSPVPGTSGRTAKVFNPATGRQSGAVDLASVEEVDTAVQSAKTLPPFTFFPLPSTLKTRMWAG